MALILTNNFLQKQVQGQQGLSGHFEMALTGRKKVAMSKLMVASNSQERHNFKHMVSFYVPIKPWPQQPHKVQVYESSVCYVLCLPFCAEVFVKREVTEARV